MESPFLYFYLLLFTFAGPFARSFERRIYYIGKWKALLISISIVSIPFILWDAYFTYKGYWGFNPRYISGLKLAGLPIEELLYFFVIPFASVFIYEVFVLFSKLKLEKHSKWVSILLLLFLLPQAFLHLDKAYTCSTFFALSAVIIYIEFVRKATFLGDFYASFLFILIPFYVVNGILTGSFIEEQVVWYNNDQNLGIRVFTIPIEDHFYGMLEMLSIIFIYERIK